MERIYVAVRVRPPTKQEIVKGSYWRVEDNHISLHNGLGTPISGYSYAFDHVFGYDSKNASIYEVHTKDVIQAAVQGFNGTVFAYGQTSSGKTYTMQGSSEDPGIIRLAVYNVFQNIQSITDREFLIRVSYMEIYNEEINDLLAPENQKLQVHENLERGIFVAGLREEIVNSPDQVFELVELGEAHRHVGQTNMNVHSSRSHTIFRMVIESRDKDAEVHSSSYDKDAVRVSVLNLVDLAGSERVAKTGAGGARLREGTHINKSLMSLGTVINKLSDGSGKQRGHIPYRDSKLTRILQPALGGNAKTAIICTVAPEEVHIDETRGTLQFASRAKRVTNCAQVNEIVTDAALLKRQKREIEELRRKLQGSHSEVLELEILKLRNDMLKFELEREKLAMELEEERKAQLERDRRIMEQQLKIDNLSTLVINSDQDRNSFKANSCEHSYLRRLSLEYSDQERRLTGNGCREASYDSHVTLRREKFLNPSVEIVDGSAEKPDSCSRRLDGSPLPPNFGNIADEDMWTNLNKGHAISDLEFLQSTPNWNRSSVRSSDISSVHGAIEGYREEIDNLRLQLGKALQEKKELEKCLEDQLTLNGELKMTIFNLENEATLIRKISQMLGSVVVDCKGGQKGISSNLQEIFAEENSLDAIRLSCTDEGNNSGPVNWKAQFVNFVNVLEEYKQENLELQNQCRMLNERLNCAVASPVPCKSQLTTAFTGCKVNDEFCEAGEVQHMFKDGVHDHSMKGLVVPEAAVKIEIDRDEELKGSNQLLVDGASNSGSFKREHMVQEEDRAVFLERLHMSAEHILSLDNKLALVNIEKDAISKALDDELHMREQKEVDAKYNKFVAEEFQRLNSALALREGIIASIHSRLLEFQGSAGKFRALNSMSQSNFSDILLAKAQV